jgi:hypothetical protein
MDLRGQKRAGQAVHAVLAFGVLVSLLVGLAARDFTLAVRAQLGASALAAAVCVPSWPFFRTQRIPFADRSSCNRCSPSPR